MKTRNRVFIAINFPENIKKKLSQARDEYPELPCKWTKRENLHLTLLFLGYLNDEETLATCKAVEEICKSHAPFFLELDKIAYGPPKKMPPRMVWASGPAVSSLSALKNDLENSLYEKIADKLNEQNHVFSPHVTLARIKEWQLRQMDKEEIPLIDEDIDLKIPVSSVEVMQSDLKKQGPEYAVLESAPLLA